VKALRVISSGSGWWADAWRSVDVDGVVQQEVENKVTDVGKQFEKIHDEAVNIPEDATEKEVLPGQVKTFYSLSVVYAYTLYDSTDPYTYFTKQIIWIC
jgi:hypothetical protein